MKIRNKYLILIVGLILGIFLISFSSAITWRHDGTGTTSPKNKLNVKGGNIVIDLF